MQDLHIDDVETLDMIITNCLENDGLADVNSLPFLNDDELSRIEPGIKMQYYRRYFRIIKEYDVAVYI